MGVLVRSILMVKMGHASILRKKKKKSPKTTQLWKTNAVIEIFISVEHDYVSVYIHK